MQPGDPTVAPWKWLCSGGCQVRVVERNLDRWSAQEIPQADRQRGLILFGVWTRQAQPGLSHILLHLPAQRGVAHPHAARSRREDADWPVPGPRQSLSLRQSALWGLWPKHAAPPARPRVESLAHARAATEVACSSVGPSA